MKVLNAHVHFHTGDYEFSHGRSPRGRGGWGFYFSADDRDDCMKCWFAPGSNTYAEAKKLALVEAKRRVAYDVWVAT